MSTKYNKISPISITKSINNQHFTFSPRMAICLLSNNTSGLASSFKIESAPPGGANVINSQ